MLKDSRYREIEKLMEEEKKYRTTCQCGWRVTIGNKYERVICPNCGRYVYSKKYKFKEKMNELLRRN